MSLAKKISELLSTTPGSYDPDEEDAPKVVEKDPEDPDDDDIETGNYRRRNVDLLEDVDLKYAGRRSSRRDLMQRDSDSEDDDDDDVSHENDEVTSDEGDSDGSAESEAESDDAQEPSLTREEEQDNIIHVSNSNALNESKKGSCVRNQLGIWENLLEIRIQLQKCLLTANRMPQAATFNDIKTQSGDAFAGKVVETRKNITCALDKLLLLKEVLRKQCPETKVNDDEEIPSDSDGGEVNPGEEEEEEELERPKKRRKLAHYENTLAVDHEKYRAYRNSVIQKWNDKTRIGVATAKTGTAHSVLDQIEYHLAETKDKLRRRTQVKRSEYEILGKTQGDNDDDECDPEIFDDGDFYHQLLRELIEAKSADVTDPVQLGQQWIRLQNLRSKMKRKIDTRATKGRKVRYAVHAKLVNFMAPVDEGGAWTDEAKTELFSSLFGKSQTAPQLT